MNNKLSHSSVTRYQTCPKSFSFHYIERLRPTTTSGALLFGSAVDVAIQELLKTGDLDKAKDVFYTNWKDAEINKVKQDIYRSVNVVYSDHDGDFDLLTSRAEAFLKAVDSNWERTLKDIIDKKTQYGWDYLCQSDKELFNIFNWWCLHRKGELMLDAIKFKIMPQIKEVLGIQVPVELTNTDGDSVIGYADLVCRFEGIKEPVVFDFKTSSIEYKSDSVVTSPQLTLYVHALSSLYENTRKAGFIVLSKRICKNKKKHCVKCGKNGTGQRHKSCDAEIEGKRCGGGWIEQINPECWVDVIVDDISPQTENLVIENIDYINQAIKAGVFVRNLQSCIMAYGKCSYWGKCHKGSDEGLNIV